MPVPSVPPDVDALTLELESAWRRTDTIFGMLQPEALLAQPVPQRHPFVYYLGHLPAFAWNQVCRGVLDRGASKRPELDDLFGRRSRPAVPGLECERTHAEFWPSPNEVLAYREDVRTAVRASSAELHQAGAGAALHSVIEHEALHQETLLHMAMRLSRALLRPQADRPEPSFDAGVEPLVVHIPAGQVTLGASLETLPFGWDHEAHARTVEVPAFDIDRTPVMNGEFLEFVTAGGYEDKAYWSEADWTWREASGLRHPTTWRQEGEGWLYRGLMEDIPLRRVFDWPVYVGWAEANAFLAWRGQRLPTEAEYRRAAYGSPAGDERCHPWGAEEPQARHGNFGWQAWSPVPVGSHPEGMSAFGVLELVGNGWEWTGSRLEPRGGSSATLPEHPEDHYVRLGASWATPGRLLRPSYRRWSLSHDPFVFGKFRGVTRA